MKATKKSFEAALLDKKHIDALMEDIATIIRDKYPDMSVTALTFAMADIASSACAMYSIPEEKFLDLFRDLYNSNSMMMESPSHATH